MRDRTPDDLVAQRDPDSPKARREKYVFDVLWGQAFCAGFCAGCTILFLYTHDWVPAALVAVVAVVQAVRYDRTASAFAANMYRVAEAYRRLRERVHPQ